MYPTRSDKWYTWACKDGKLLGRFMGRWLWDFPQISAELLHGRMGITGSSGEPCSHKGIVSCGQMLRNFLTPPPPPYLIPPRGVLSSSPQQDPGGGY